METGKLDGFSFDFDFSMNFNLQKILLDKQQN
jgi:hypothetical protein